MIINDIVAKLIAEHKGGEKFFDALDKQMKNKNIIDFLFTKAYTEYNTPFKVIVSGKFGLYFKEVYNTVSDKLFIVNGNLRHENIISLEPMQAKIKGYNFIFFDDSFYLGRTRDKIKQELKKYGGTLLTTYVCYDGSKVKDDTVHSLYRYYN